MLTPLPGKIDAVVFDIGRVLVQWSIRNLYAKLIDDPARLDWFLAHVVTEQWNFEHDAGKPLAQLVAERSALFPAEAELIALYPQRWLETVPGPIPGTAALVEALAARGHPLYAITNFGAETWAMFRPTCPVLDHFADIVVSGRERMVKPDPAIYALAQTTSAAIPRECCSSTTATPTSPAPALAAGTRTISGMPKRSKSTWWRGACWTDLSWRRALAAQPDHRNLPPIARLAPVRCTAEAEEALRLRVGVLLQPHGLHHPRRHQPRHDIARQVEPRVPVAAVLT